MKFTYVTDHLGCDVMLCDDASVVRLLAHASGLGWREIPDVAFGYSQDCAPGSAVHSHVMALTAAMDAAGLGYVGWLYSADAWDMSTGRSKAGFIADRAAGRVVCRMPTFGYTPTKDRANTSVRFQG